MLFLHYIDKTNPIDGNLLTVLDYSLFCQDNNIKHTSILILPSYTYNVQDKLDFEQLLFKLIKSRYNNHEKIRVYTCDEHQIKELVTLKFTKLVCSDRTFEEIHKMDIHFILQSKKFIIYRTWHSFYNREVENPNNYSIIILNENPSCGNYNYNRKIYFDGLRNTDCNENTAFILANGERRISEDYVEEYLSPKYKDKYDKIILVSNYKLEVQKPFIWYNTLYLPDLFNYKTFIYCGSNNYDYSPRMLLESIYLNKEIIMDSYPLNYSDRFLTVVKPDLLTNYTLDLSDAIINDF